ncbi:PEGA domain-containing protein [Sphaerochaeta globosa]|uniref:PEGA domain-containing protein n=1 Tax=Sphaerochaeta globosa (strain ATCC BAA-1886 / DSM 22777 / Buddy) TaxID=158189 RepID=F0RX60_SPHGB|nr:PEGA domain-containing protein [Sphaerochaeta globosa]ADY11910.1 hypothetical protein SpiBuddy_0065 [Sphaerochaeta globosa str. Buddy]
MKKIVVAMLVLVSLLALTGCATVVSDSTYPVTITSEPQGAKITITDSANRVVYVGSTPASVSLEAGSGFFSKASYTIKFEKAGFEPSLYTLTSTIDGWYWGNLLVGGVLGMVIIDPMTGAMWKLDPTVFVELESTQSGLTVSVMDVNNAPESWKSAMVRIS